MSEVKHTPGPWKAHYLPQHRMRVTTDLGVPALGNDTICDIALWNVDYDQQMANARLIAAAPDLLNALMEVVSLSDRKHDAWDRARAAIAAANPQEPSHDD